MVRVGEDQGIPPYSLVMCVHGTPHNAIGVIPEQCSITTEPSHRFTGAHHSAMLRLFWLGLASPPEHVQNRL